VIFPSSILLPAAAKIDLVAKVSNLQKVSIVARVAARQARATRIGGAILSGAQAAFGSFARILRQLWLEVTGLFFLVLAAVFATAGVREYVKYQAGEASGPGRLILAACFTVTFAWFGVSSFWRVRKNGQR
jgi:hypothetical protein